MPRRKAQKETPVVVKNAQASNPEVSANDEQNPNNDKAKTIALEQASINKKAFASTISFGLFIALAVVTTNLWAPIFYFSVFGATSSFIFLLFTADKKIALNTKMKDTHIEQDVDALAKTLIASDRSFTAKFNRIKAHFAKIETLETIEKQSPLISSKGEFNTAMVRQHVGKQLKAAVEAQGQDKETLKNTLMEDLNHLEAYADAKIKTLKAKRVIHKMRRS